MNQKPTVAVIDGAFVSDVSEMFERWGFKTTQNLGAAGAIVFTGGADLDPKLYGHERIPQCGYAQEERDEAEAWIYNKYKGKPMIGICRGAQLLNVMNGGTLFQHVNNHGSPHVIHDRFRKVTFQGTSLHHQQMRPTAKGVVIAVANTATARYGHGIQEIAIPTDKRLYADWGDPEVVFYPETKALCYQGHPEIAAYHEKQYFFGLVSQHLKLAGNSALLNAEARLKKAAEDLKAIQGKPQTQEQAVLDALRGGAAHDHIHGTD